MSVRDELEAVIRGWNAYEINRGAVPVIDFDFRPDITDTIEITSRLDAYTRCQQLLTRAEQDGDDERVIGRAQADVDYLGAMLGERRPLREYVLATQGCDPTGWPADHITERGEQAKAALADLGVSWGPKTTDELHELEGPIDMDQAVDEMRKAAETHEPAVRALADTDAPFDLTVEITDVDAYWAYWLDGAGSSVRVRLNQRNAKDRFSSARATQFALHEILGHGLQSASIAANARENDVPWVRLLSVHARQQVLLEGLAQAMPLFVLPDDQLLTAIVRLDHYVQLVRSELHLAINRGDAIQHIADHARQRVPFWKDESIANTLTDTSVNPQLRSYLWAYPAGLDWFVRLAESDVPRHEVFLASYREPLSPDNLDLLLGGVSLQGGVDQVVARRGEHEEV